MAKELNPPSKLRLILTWCFIFGGIAFWIILALWHASRQPSVEEKEPAVFRFIFMTILGGFLLGLSLCCYLVVIVTHCLTFSFKKPVWPSLKKKMYLANICVSTIGMLGVGFMLSAVITPVLNNYNLPGSMSSMLPVLGSICVLQIVFIWVLIWSPLEKGIIQQRLLALGITREQMAGGMFIGLSNPAVKGTGRRFWCIEEDVGMLWFTPQQLIYWGDTERMGIGHEQLIQLERRTDAKSTTALSGTAYVILHVRLLDGSVRLIRLHTEGIWTLFGKRRASDDLAAQITAWHVPAQVVSS